MIKLLLSLLMSQAHAVNLVQEQSDIECVSTTAKVLVDKRDRFIEVTTNGKTDIYESLEFLDSGILLKHKVKNEHAIFQLTPKHIGVVTIGKLVNFTESKCRDTGASKTCVTAIGSLFWSPERLLLNLSTTEKINTSVKHYGVYPNDGTYFLGLSNNDQGIHLVDFGANISMVVGKATKTSCSYK